MSIDGEPGPWPSKLPVTAAGRAANGVAVRDLRAVVAFLVVLVVALATAGCARSGQTAPSPTSAPPSATSVPAGPRDPAPSSTASPSTTVTVPTSATGQTLTPVQADNAVLHVLCWVDPGHQISQIPDEPQPSTTRTYHRVPDQSPWFPLSVITYPTEVDIDCGTGMHAGLHQISIDEYNAVLHGGSATALLPIGSEETTPTTAATAGPCLSPEQFRSTVAALNDPAFPPYMVTASGVTNVRCAGDFVAGTLSQEGINSARVVLVRSSGGYQLVNGGSGHVCSDASPTVPSDLWTALGCS